jgi:hypothetical protein
MFESERVAQDLPRDLLEMAPGLELGQVLAALDRHRLTGYDRVVLLEAHARQVAHYQAELHADIQAVWEAEREAALNELSELSEAGLVLSSEIDEMASSEIRAALTLTRRAADVYIDLAHGLMVRQPAVWAALHEGRIDLAKARILCEQTSHLEDETARQVAGTALQRAPGQTTGQLRARVARLCISADPGAARQRYEQRLGERRVVSEPTEAGTANLYGLELPVADTARAMRRINSLARSLNTSDDPRTIDQIRADVFLDLLNGRQPKVGSNDRGTVDIRVDLDTLTGLSESPGEIPGWGPVIADIARQVTERQHDAEWRVTVTGEDGGLLHVGTTRRRPTADQRRQVEFRSPTCVFPGCRMPAADSDLDHNHPWAQYHRTATDDLAPLCRHDHTTRHRRGWRIKRLRHGVYQWTSPLGHTYTVGPDPPDTA